MEAPLSEPFFRRRMKMLSRSDDFMLYGKMGVGFCCTSGLLYPYMKIGIRLFKARPNFYLISDTPASGLELLIAHFTLVVLISRLIITGNERTCLLTLLWSTTILETLAKTFIIPVRQNQFLLENIMLQFVGLQLQWIQTLHSLDFILKIHCGLNNSIWDNLHYSEEVSQS